MKSAAQSYYAGRRGNCAQAVAAAWIAVSGPREDTVKLSTGSSNRFANMQSFAAAALRLLEETLG